MTDNTGLMGDTTNHRINIQRPGAYLIHSECSFLDTTFFPIDLGESQVLGGASGTTSLRGCFGSSHAGFAGSSINFPTICALSDQIILQGYCSSSTGEFAVNAGPIYINSLSATEIPIW